MKVLAIIPARGGSKGIPMKNIADLNGRPLIDWTIQDAIQSNVIDYIHVSTDSIEISKVAKESKANCEFLRTTDISGDQIGTGQAILQSLAELEKIGKSFDIVLELQPTYCFRGKKIINEVVNNLKREIKNGIESIVTCVLVNDTSHPDFIIDQYSNGTLNFGKKKPDEFARQYLKPALACKGIVLASTVKSYIKNKSFFTDKTLPYIIDDQYSEYDINTQYDLKIARLISQERSR
jgi:CMP-N-acetylneuraminic acid synthetase